MVPAPVCQRGAGTNHIQIFIAGFRGRKFRPQAPIINKKIPKIIAVADRSFANDCAVIVCRLRPHFNGKIACTEVAKRRVLNLNLVVGAVQLYGLGFHNW